MSSSLPMLLVMLFAHVAKRSNSRSHMFFKTGVLKNFAIFTGKHLCWNHFLIKLQDWRPAFLFKKRLQHRCFSVITAKFLRTAFFPKFYLMIISYYCKIRRRNRKKFTIDRSKFLVKGWFFSQVRFQFSSKDFFFLLFDHFTFTEICQ